FETMFEKLQRFKEEHNHVNVPVKYKEDPQLGHWPSKPDNGGSVRYLDKEKMDRLDSIGFSWSMMRGSTAGRAPPKSFDENLQDLHLFYQQYGKWPSRSDPLGNFVKDLRKSYSKKNEKFMKERAPKLDRIGFQWVVPDLPWETRMKQIQDFSSKFGHLNIDHNVKSQGNLGGFAVQMTSLYNSWKAGADTSPDMIAKFQEIAGLGFAFNIYPKNWDQQYNELVKYKQRNGSARVPLKYKADMRLGTWVKRMRSQYKAQKLASERIEKLESVGF
ncbi:predicted protein, partial [Thalassiosira pseudonana CCMP1335]